MLGVFAEFETNLRREQRLEGIAKTKATGVYKGRQASIDASGTPIEIEGLGPQRLPRRWASVGRAFTGFWRLVIDPAGKATSRHLRSVIGHRGPLLVKIGRMRDLAVVLYCLNKDRSMASAIALYPASFGWR
jgi:DNA invertase Pin-like site-specific DNA recombinase